jgi:hypothetical protein
LQAGEVSKAERTAGGHRRLDNAHTVPELSARRPPPAAAAAGPLLLSVRSPLARLAVQVDEEDAAVVAADEASSFVCTQGRQS